MKLGYEEDAYGNRQPVEVEDFDMEEVYRRVDGFNAGENLDQRDAVREALWAILDAVIPEKMRNGDPGFVESVGRNTMIFALACGHNSSSSRKVCNLAKEIGVTPKYASKRLAVMRKRCGM